MEWCGLTTIGEAAHPLEGEASAAYALSVDTPVPPLVTLPAVNPEPAARKRSIGQGAPPEALARLTPEERAHLEADSRQFAPQPVRTPTLEGLARVDAFLASLPPREREFLEELNRLDRLDYERDR